MKYSSFSDKYLKEKEMKQYFGGKEDSFEAINTWATDVVDFFTEKHPDFTFKVVFTLVPNPSNYKGMDDIKIVVWKQPRSRYDSLTNTNIIEKPWMAVVSKHCHKVIDCIQDVHDKMAKLFPEPKDEIVEIDGKKYKLTEIK